MRVCALVRVRHSMHTMCTARAHGQHRPSALSLRPGRPPRWVRDRRGTRRRSPARSCVGLGLGLGLGLG
eukprot:scaffold104160_cov63-Phaeocystis_antarctica.AAC.1